jgi:hypothetical protein
MLRLAHGKGLGVGVDGDELHALHPGFDHAIDRIETGTAHSDYPDHGKGTPRRLDERAPAFVGVLRGLSPLIATARPLQRLLPPEVLVFCVCQASLYA